MRVALFVLSFLVLPFIASAQLEPECKPEAEVRLSEPVESTEAYEVFGSAWEAGEPAMSVDNAVARLGESEGLDARFSGTVDDVCQVKGCWMVISAGGKQARVHFTDYSFFMPTNIRGKKVELRGVLVEKTISEEQAKHYAEDSQPGSSEAVSGPHKEYSVVASSVKVYR